MISGRCLFWGAVFLQFTVTYASGKNTLLLTETHCVNVWGSGVDLTHKDPTYKPMTLCPDVEYYTDPGIMFITSGFLHTGKYRLNPPEKAVPKWQDAFELEAGTYMFDNSYCLVKVLKGVSKILDAMGLVQGPSQCVINCHPPNEEEQNPYFDEEYRNDVDPDSAITNLICRNNKKWPSADSSSAVPQTDGNPEAENVAQNIASDDSIPQVANVGGLSITDSENRDIDLASAGDTSIVPTTENPANTGNSEEPFANSNNGNRPYDPSSGINNGDDGTSAWTNTMGSGQGATKRARGFRRRAGVWMGTLG